MSTGDVPFPRRIRLPHATYADASAAFHVIVRARVEARPFRGRVGTAVWDTLMDETSLDRVRMTAACLMPDHLHLVASPAGMDVIKWVNALKSLTTRRAWEAGWNGVLWQPRFFDRLLRDESEYYGALNYIRDNPVAAGLVEDSAEWEWLFLAP